MSRAPATGSIIEIDGRICRVFETVIIEGRLVGMTVERLDRREGEGPRALVVPAKGYDEIDVEPITRH